MSAELKEASRIRNFPHNNTKPTLTPRSQTSKPQTTSFYILVPLPIPILHSYPYKNQPALDLVNLSVPLPTMSPLDRLRNLASHLTSAPPTAGSSQHSHAYIHRHNFHTLSPTFFLWRAAQIEPDVTPPIHPCHRISNPQTFPTA